MADSPRACQGTGFDAAWHESDAASFDPASFPVSRLPRAWDRKPKTVVSRDGKPKKVWRRYATRSTTANTTAPKETEDEEEEHDSRSRAVKRLQRLGPAEMEHISALPNGKKRAFKATRWDRRKSVLPRKRATVHDHTSGPVEELTVTEPVVDDALEPTRADAGNATEGNSMEEQGGFEVVSSTVDGDRRRSTFTFTVETHVDVRHSLTMDTTRKENEDLLAMSDEEIRDIEAISMPLPPIQECASPPTATEPVIEEAYVNLSSPTGDETEPMDAVARTAGEEEESNRCEMETPESRIQLANIPGDDISNSPPELSIEEGMASFLDTDANDVLGNDEPEESPENTDSPGAESTSFDGPGLGPFPRSDAVDTNGHVEIQEQSIEEESQPIVPDDNSTSDGAYDDEGLSEFTIELGDISSNDVSQIVAVEDGEKTTKQEFTEQSLQLAIQSDMDMPAALPALTAGAYNVDDPPRERSSPADHTCSHEVDTVGSPVEEVPKNEMPAIQVEPSTHTVDINEDDDEVCAPLEGEEDENINGQAACEGRVVKSPGNPLDDIADGLTLTPSLSVTSDYAGRKMRTLSPPPSTEFGLDDATTTMHLDDDTALLKDFLTRAAASKANKVANIARRTSAQNRRDSDAVRLALASPRKILEEKDPNSPSKYDNDATLDLSQTLTLNLDQQIPPSPTPEQTNAEGLEDGKASKNSRRSTRTRKSRLPAPQPTTQQIQTPKNISVRRADGGEPIVLKKTEAQELGLLTRTNTRKNKQGSVCVAMRLLTLSTEAASVVSQEDATTSSTEPQPGKKNVRWDATLAYYQEITETIANALAEAESLATPDELSASVSTPSSKRKAKESRDKKGETPRLRRVRGLGAANGTPAKGLLASASMFPDSASEEREEKAQRLPKTNKFKKMAIAPNSTDATPASKPPESQLPTLELAPVGTASTKEPMIKERKSRLATPRKVKLPQLVPAVPSVLAEGKENQQQTRGIVGATPKKGLKLPEVIVPSAAAVDSGLPRRRPGRKI